MKLHWKYFQWNSTIAEILVLKFLKYNTNIAVILEISVMGEQYSHVWRYCHVCRYWWNVWKCKYLNFRIVLHTNIINIDQANNISPILFYYSNILFIIIFTLLCSVCFRRKYWIREKVWLLNVFGMSLIRYE